MYIDPNYNFHLDTPEGKDPDTYSKTLNNYHIRLWSKKLPSNNAFNLKVTSSAPYYLKYKNKSLDLILSSDSIIHTYSGWESMREIRLEVGEDKIANFLDMASNISGYIIFPAKRINNKPTINVIRGLHPRIRDRFDLTLECIRLWYIKIDNPLTVHIERYSDFFNLFVDFKGYVDFFLLNDLVTKDYKEVLFWKPFDNFNTKTVVPTTAIEYEAYISNVINFSKARMKRILESNKKLI